MSTLSTETCVFWGLSGLERVNQILNNKQASMRTLAKDTKCRDGMLEVVQKMVWFIGVLHHMQRYFSHICDGQDVQAD